MYVDTTEPKKLCSSIQDLVEQLAESKVKNITVTHCCTELNISDNKPIFDEGYRFGWREGYQEGNSDI